MKQISLSLLAIAFFTSASLSSAGCQEISNQFANTFTYKSLDDLTVTADLYTIDNDTSLPFIILCHQAGWSRGEYREIAPKLNAIGFNCLAIDQRSGGEVNDVANETFKLAKSAQQETNYTDAEQDILAAVNHVRTKNLATGKLILWGSSYSAALVLRIAGENPDMVDGVLSFAPGEYFQRLGKPANWIALSAAKITAPVFITSAKSEYNNWSAIFGAIAGDNKTKFIPKTKGNHGSRALWEKFDDSGDYWNAVTPFLKQFHQAR